MFLSSRLKLHHLDWDGDQQIQLTHYESGLIIEYCVSIFTVQSVILTWITIRTTFANIYLLALQFSTIHDNILWVCSQIKFNHHPGSYRNVSH